MALILVLYCISMFLFSDCQEKFVFPLTQRADVITSVETYFRSGCVFLVKSLDQKSQGEELELLLNMTMLINSQDKYIKQYTVGYVFVLHSLLLELTTPIHFKFTDVIATL
jgi:hypothetical protein